VNTSGFLFSWSILALTLVAAIFDARTKRIPNVLTLGALLVAPALHAIVVPRILAVSAAEWSLIAGAMGALGGPRLGLEAVFLSFFSLVGFACLRLTWRGELLRSIWNGALSLGTRRRAEIKEAAPVRFGPFACVGAVLALLLHGGGLF
jgi:prepilin signal peptidase PulO-like enzyme (type II secretory pathway)